MTIRTIVSRIVPLVVIFAGARAHAQTPRFEIVVPATAHAGPVTGRVVLLLARDSQPEPRFLLSPQGPAIFGIDLDQLVTGQVAVIDSAATAYPMPLQALPPGEYWAQAVINVYSV